MSPAEIALVVLGGLFLVAVYVAALCYRAGLQMAERAVRAESERDAALDREEKAAARSRTAQAELTNDVHRLTAERDEARADNTRNYREWWTACHGFLLSCGHSPEDIADLDPEQFKLLGMAEIVEMSSMRSERDAALRDKAAQFEEAQRQIATLRKDYAQAQDGLAERDEMLSEREARIVDLEAASAICNRRVFELVSRAERAEKVAAAAAKLFNGKDDDGEFRELKEAVREWEGGAS